LVAEAFENQNIARDSIVQQLPFCILKLRTKQGQEQELRLHPIMRKDEQGRPLLRKDGKLLTERYFANWNQADLVLIQERVFGKVLWALFHRWCFIHVSQIPPNIILYLAKCMYFTLHFAKYNELCQLH